MVVSLALVNHRSLAVLLFTVAAALASVLILWALLDEDTPLSADEMVEHICTGGVTYPEFYDVSIAVSATQGISIQHETIEYRIAPEAAHILSMDAEGRGQIEMIILLLPVTSTTGANLVSEDSRDSAEEHIFYRAADSPGQWQEWVTSPREPRGMRSVPQSGQDIYRFCRSLPDVLGEVVEFHYIGEQMVDGVNTMLFYQSHKSPGYEDYRTREFWVDSDGLFRQVKETHYGDFNQEGELESYYVALRIYSGWGETNVITAPQNATSWSLAPTPAR